MIIGNLQISLKINLMIDLYKAYQDLYTDEEKWKYYSKLDGENPFGSYIASRDFITKFIQLSGKSNENPLYEQIIKLDENRIKHIVSVFFYGTYLYHSVSSIKYWIDKVIVRYQFINPDSTIEFSFIWFLICLFHDLGYGIEENSNFKDFDEFITGKVKYFLNNKVGVPKAYENIYKNYFNYRLNSSIPYIRKPDHGICGGILLYNELNKILLRKQRLNKDSEGLSWNSKLKYIYRYASWIVLSHNIFFIREGDSLESEYRRNDLQELILSKDEKPKVNYKQHPFLYLFMLVDSIDPIKISGDFLSLNHIKIETSEDEILFEIIDKNIRDNYFNRINGLKEWLVPEIIEDGNTIRILIR